MKTLFIAALALLFPCLATAHPGKTDRYGGHKCYKECAEWDLFYAEYHLHDKNGRPVKAARKKPVRPKPETTTMEDGSSDTPAETTLSPPAAAAAVADEPGSPSLPWILLVLFLLLLFVVRRNRRKASDAKQAAISR